MPLAHDRHVGELRIELVDIGALADEAVLHHQQAVDRLLRAGGAERMAGQRLRRRDRRAFVAGAEHLADRVDLRPVAGRRRGGVRVDVADLLVHRGKRHAHAALAAFAGRRHHVVAVGGGAVADDLAVDLGAARLGVLQLLQHQNAGAAGDDEAVARARHRRARPCRGVSLNFDDIAPIASKSTESVQSSSSQPPAKIMSCLPSWMVS